MKRYCSDRNGVRKTMSAYECLEPDPAAESEVEMTGRVSPGALALCPKHLVPSMFGQSAR